MASLFGKYNNTILFQRTSLPKKQKKKNFNGVPIQAKIRFEYRTAQPMSNF